MNVENQYLMQIYQVLMSIRDSVEFALVGVESKPSVFYLRKELLENGLKVGPLVNIMQIKGELGTSVKNSLFSLYNDLYVNGKYLKVEDDKVSKFDDGQNSEIIERLVGNYTVVDQILNINMENIKKNGKLDSKMEALIYANNQYYGAMYAYALFINVVEERAKTLMSGEVDLSNNKELTRIMSTYMFFKNKLKNPDEDVKECIESIDADIDLIGEGEVGDQLIKNLEVSYHLLEETLHNKQVLWQEAYKAVVGSISE